MIKAGVCDISIIVPTFREADNLAQLIGGIDKAMSAEKLCYEVIVVDDNSPDHTGSVIAELASAGLPVTLIQRPRRMGLSSAVLCGFARAAGGALVCMDADHSHRPELLPELLKPLMDRRADITIGSRYIPGGSMDNNHPFINRLNSRVATMLARPFTPVRDPMSGFFALRRQVLPRRQCLKPLGYKILLELLVKCPRQTRVVEIPIRFTNRAAGRSKLTWRQRLQYMMHLARLTGYKLRTVATERRTRKNAMSADNATD